jgi:Zn-dependent metalloprotease
MNEAFSDIWGACVEYYAAPSKSTWLIGEDNENGAAALRSMSDPKLKPA